jgi:hypothetical protein
VQAHRQGYCRGSLQDFNCSDPFFSYEWLLSQSPTITISSVPSPHQISKEKETSPFRSHHWLSRKIRRGVEPFQTHRCLFSIPQLLCCQSVICGRRTHALDGLRRGRPFQASPVQSSLFKSWRWRCTNGWISQKSNPSVIFNLEHQLLVVLTLLATFRACFLTENHMSRI